MFGQARARDTSGLEATTGGNVRFVFTRTLQCAGSCATGLSIARLQVVVFYVCRDQSASTGTSQAAQNRFASSSEPAETMTASETSSGKKGGLMQRLLAKVHKAEHQKPVGRTSQQQYPQQGQPETLPKSTLNVRRVSIADESKENIPADSFNAQASAQPQVLQERSILSSSLPSTPAESALPAFCRRSSVADDHHLQAFEASAPGRLALAIAPELGEVKGMLHLSMYLCACKLYLECAEAT